MNQVGARKLSIAFSTIAMALVNGPAVGVDGISITAGTGAGNSAGMDTRLARVALQWQWGKQWFKGKDWHLGGYWNADIGYWKRDAAPGQNDDLTEIGLTPVFRFQRNDLEGPYVEGGIGAHFLSQTSLGDKNFSTSFQFGSHLGFGYRFGSRKAWDIGYAFQHLSNADIKKPNDGIDFHELRLQYHF